MGGCGGLGMGGEGQRGWLCNDTEYISNYISNYHMSTSIMHVADIQSSGPEPGTNVYRRLRLRISCLGGLLSISLQSRLPPCARCPATSPSATAASVSARAARAARARPTWRRPGRAGVGPAGACLRARAGHSFGAVQESGRVGLLVSTRLLAALTGRPPTGPAQPGSCAPAPGGLSEPVRSGPPRAANPPASRD